ncbi:MAG: hypothetical protein A2431_03525 [Candidatus Zambryskibacteria bacterium RIFOXYC1_FULL_39_10]|uniref:Uncharacterized protein n=1 Tax=Candidatus Zambryskibacteria bacterium RIFOXYC1_FULL_39_10 TaxID=1802779 RepID=A0A1G2UYF8_9BACT|nr:MAG: hypothetical protein A2431_03525 [Candidatus Zambryskibacteria bacterium RIFOXYC1_FULL_39_10]OHB16810.1 MAG: hypothetical protein A2605_01325 [Candidatus Zambryskibacteria bacterium RIFOXYD1_FULL_39_35]
MNTGTILGVIIVLLLIAGIFIFFRNDNSSVQIETPDIISRAMDTDIAYSDSTSLLTGNIR